MIGSAKLNRNDRQQVAELIRRYLNGDMTAFDFDDAIWNYRDSDDKTVGYVVDQVWYFYDDCDDHLVALDKPAWNYHQRMLLLLESNFTVESTTSRRWSWTQLVAATALLGFVATAQHFGWGKQLLIFGMPFGTVSIAISRYRQPTQNDGPYADIVRPFASIADLQHAYESAATFKKRCCPTATQQRHIRSPAMSVFWSLYYLFGWMVCAPVPLAWQLLPIKESRTVAKPSQA